MFAIISLNKSKKLDREDKKIDRALKAIEGAITLAKDNSYTDNAYPVEIHSVITSGEACMEYAVSVVRAMGFKHSDMKEGKKGQTWYKASGQDILVASIIGTLFGNNMVTIILHAIENSDHNNDILNGVLESVALIEGQQDEEYKARKAKEAEDKKKAEQQRDERRYSKGTTGDKKKNVVEDLERSISSGITSIDRMSARDIKNPYKHNDFKTVNDTTNRHMRRHPKQYKEGTIFESVEFI